MTNKWKEAERGSVCGVTALATLRERCRNPAMAVRSTSISEQEEMSDGRQVHWDQL